jgi:hypothetical protein
VILVLSCIHIVVLAVVIAILLWRRWHLFLIDDLSIERARGFQLQPRADAFHIENMVLVARESNDQNILLYRA